MADDRAWGGSIGYDLRGDGDCGVGACDCARCDDCSGAGGAGVEANDEGLSTFPSASEMDGSDCRGLMLSFSFSLVLRDSGGVWTECGQVFVGGAALA